MKAAKEFRPPPGGGQPSVAGAGETARPASAPEPTRSDGERGAAMVMALVVVAVAATLGARLAWQRQLTLRALEAAQLRQAADALALTGIDWARLVLRADAQRSPIDHRGEAWAAAMPTQHAPAAPGQPAAQIDGGIDDEQARFNLNSLVERGRVSPAALAAYRRLLQLLGLPPQLAASAADWIDADDAPLADGGAERTAYAAGGRRPPNRPLAALDELRHVAGYDAAAIERLRPWLTVLPEATPVNLNTASPTVLAAIAENLSLAAAGEFAAARAGAPLPTLAAAGERLDALKARAANGLVAVSSRYFRVDGRIRLAANPPFERRFAAVLRREGQLLPDVLAWRPLDTAAAPP